MARLDLEIVYIDTKISGHMCALRAALQYGKDFAHGCNTRGIMGAGVAARVTEMVPSLQKLDSVTCADIGSELMGNFIRVRVGRSQIANFYTQEYPGSGSLSYEAVQNCFSRWISLEDRNEFLYIPAIGCGIAGGERSLIIQSIHDAMRSAESNAKPLIVRMVVWDADPGSAAQDIELIQAYRIEMGIW